MSKAALDSDLYGGASILLLYHSVFNFCCLDIYGDDDNEFAVPLEAEDWDEPATSEKDEQPENSPPPASASTPHKPATPATQDALHALPAKPQSPDSASLSYSAQIAQQFSAYQQTPSQERQQRAEIPLPPNPRNAGAGGPSTIATHETITPNADSIFGKKPSEMHDSG
jgi:RNA-binding protein Musashi